MTSPSLEELRDWQRNQEFSLVIEALNAIKETCPPREKAVLALSLIMAGSDEAQRMLQEVAAQDPDPADVLWQSDVALACMLTGQGNKSFDLLQRAVASPGATPVEYGRLAVVYLARNDLDKAREFYQEAVHREPGQGIWHNNLAGILVRQQRLEEALENYDIALKLKPDLEQARNSRFQVLQGLERSEEVVRELEGMLEDNPADFLLRLRLARAFDLDNQFTAAIKVLRDAMLPVDKVEPPREDLSPEEKSKTPWAEQIALRMELARIFSQRSRHGMALRALKQVEKLGPDNPLPCFVQQASALGEMGRYDEALETLDAAEVQALEAENDPGSGNHPDPAKAEDASRPDNPCEHPPLTLDMTRASVLCEKGEYKQAEAIQRRLLATYPGHAQLLTQLGQTLLWTGKLDEAADCFEQASEINPMALAQMINARRLPEDPRALEKMRQLADNPLLAEQSRITMGFALADLYEKRKEPDEAWPYLALANRLTNRKIVYNAGLFSKKVDVYKKVFTREFFARQAPIRNSNRTPVFVVGMPRSGTTLTEQILCSHPDIFGAGELDLISRMTQLMPRVLKIKKQYPAGLDLFTPLLREDAARFYLYGLDTYDTEHPYVVDKMPHNFMQLGFISLIFPKAKIIHVQRDPRDTALSNFQQNFKAKHGGLGYAFDLEKIAFQINDYHRIMAHWRKVLPVSMFEFRYEDLVGDQEYWSRKLLGFVGVEWDESVRDFHKTERAVRTASVSQVRQPIYKTSKQKWRRYAKHLGPLLDNLDQDVTAPCDAMAEGA